MINKKADQMLPYFSVGFIASSIISRLCNLLTENYSEVIFKFEG